ncbi:MAG: 3-hydroxyacyl-CoA dehydrogenase [Frankiaceae bacterium]|nr:3-hydroxyacyl-CoA dehydrogenase [Frankiaceae bacterium]
MRIEGSSAIVTGGASGLGLATATELAKAGAHVVIADLPNSAGAERASELGGTFAPVDVTDESAVQQAVDAASAAAPLRIVVNCAGIGNPGRVIGKSGVLPLDQFRAVITVNLIGTFNVIRLAAARMVETEPVDGERGVIVNTASVAAFDGQIGQAAYSASKGGVVGMTLPIARDLADKYIRVCTIAPGIMDTPMLAGLPEPARESLGKQVPHPARLGLPAEYAALARHIVENGYLNGETIRLDGSIRMAPR